jgi:hypothetical protein
MDDEPSGGDLAEVKGQKHARLAFQVPATGAPVVRGSWDSAVYVAASAVPERCTGGCGDFAS